MALAASEQAVSVMTVLEWRLVSIQAKLGRSFSNWGDLFQTGEIFFKLGGSFHNEY